VLQTKALEDADAELRPGWHWVLIGAVFVVTLFLPLSMLGVYVGGLLARGRASNALSLVLVAGAVLATFAFSAGASGAMVGRFSGRPGTRTAMWGGALGGLATFALALLAGRLGLAPALAAALVLSGTGALFAALGARVGLRARPK